MRFLAAGIVFEVNGFFTNVGADVGRKLKPKLAQEHGARTSIL